MEQMLKDMEFTDLLESERYFTEKWEKMKNNRDYERLQVISNEINRRLGL